MLLYPHSVRFTRKRWTVYLHFSKLVMDILVFHLVVYSVTHVMSCHVMSWSVTALSLFQGVAGFVAGANLRHIVFDCYCLSMNICTHIAISRTKFEGIHSSFNQVKTSLTSKSPFQQWPGQDGSKDIVQTLNTRQTYKCNSHTLQMSEHNVQWETKALDAYSTTFYLTENKVLDSTPAGAGPFCAVCMLPPRLH